jgi:hypothetical protein
MIWLRFDIFYLNLNLPCAFLYWNEIGKPASISIINNNIILGLGAGSSHRLNSSPILALLHAYFYVPMNPLHMYLSRVQVWHIFQQVSRFHFILCRRGQKIRVVLGTHWHVVWDLPSSFSCPRTRSMHWGYLSRLQQHGGWDHGHPGTEIRPALLIFQVWSICNSTLRICKVPWILGTYLKIRRLILRCMPHFEILYLGVGVTDLVQGCH